MKSFALPIVIVALLGLAAVAGWSRQGTGDPDVIKLVSSLPRTGSAKAQTDTVVNGIRLALEEANWHAGDFEITYGDWDDATAAAGQWTAEAEIANARRAVRHPNVMAYIGTYNSGAAKLSMPILNKAHLLMISPGSTWPGLTKPGKGDPGEPEIYQPAGEITFVRVVPADDLQAPCAARWAAEQLGVKRVYVLDDNEMYGKGIATLFVEACQNLGIEVLGQESIDAKAQEFKALMTTIKAQQPDLVYFGGTTQSKGGQIAKDMMAVGLDCKLMVPDGCMEMKFIESAGAKNLNDRCYVTFGGVPGGKFTEKYQRRYGSKPEAYAIYGYEAAKVALEAIRRAGKKDRAAIVAACLSITDFDSGALGKWSFDKHGDTTLMQIGGYRVHDGEFEFVKALEP